MKKDSSSRVTQLLPLFALLLVYLMLCVQFITKPVANSEASNYLHFFQLSPTGESLSTPRHKLITQEVYFGPLSLWTTFFGSSLTSIRSFSVFCGAFIIFIFFFIFRNKLNTKKILSFISILTLNPLFIYFATSFDSSMELLLVLSIFYTGLFLLYRAKLKDLISFRYRRHLINWRALVLDSPTKTKSQTIFLLSTSLLAIALIIGTLLVGLKQDTSFRKILTAIYQSENIATPPIHPNKSNEQSNQQKSPLIVDQYYSSSLIVENLLVAKELGKTPLPFYWSFSLSSLEQQLKNPQDFWFLSKKDQSSSDLQKQFSKYRESESIKIDHYSVKHFVTER